MLCSERLRGSEVLVRSDVTVCFACVFVTYTSVCVCVGGWVGMCVSQFQCAPPHTHAHTHDSYCVRGRIERREGESDSGRCMCVYVCVCVLERERERDTHTERQRGNTSYTNTQYIREVTPCMCVCLCVSGCVLLRESASGETVKGNDVYTNTRTCNQRISHHEWIRVYVCLRVLQV